MANTSRPSSRSIRSRTSAAASQLRLADGDDFRLGRQRRPIQFQFAADGAVVLQRIAAVGWQRLDEMDQHARPLDVAQELVAKADAAGCAPSIRPGKSARTKARSPPIGNDAEIGMLGGERIIADFRLSARQPAQQRGLAGVGQADQAGVGDDLQLQDDPALLAGRAGLRLARRPVGRVAKARLPRPPRPPWAMTTCLTGCGQVAQDVARGRGPGSVCRAGRG